MNDGEVRLFMIWVVVFVLFWNFDTPEGVDYRYDMYDLIYQNWSNDE
jgi:hypothetical protein